MQLIKGANAPIDGTGLTVSWDRNPGKAEIDVSAYLLTSDRKVEGDEGMAFYGQPNVPGVAFRANGAGRSAALDFDLPAIPDEIEAIAICVVIDNSNDPSAKLADAGMLRLNMGALSFELDLAGMSEQAIILSEVYRRNGAFKLRAVGQGFNGGLAAMATHFGVDVAGESTAQAPAAATTSAQSTPAPTPAPTPTVSIKKVTLAKSEKVNLDKKGGAIRAQLVWEGRRGGEGDLDLYCFYVLKDGTCGKVYWKDLGRSHGLPFITLSGDSKQAGQEEIILHRPEELRFALFAAYSAVGNGVGSFESFRPKMILTDQQGSEVTIPLLNPNSTAYWVAISHLDIRDTISIEHVETYGKSGVRAFIAAERSPRLHADGTWDVSKGPVEFKRK